MFRQAVSQALNKHLTAKLNFNANPKNRKNEKLFFSYDTTLNVSTALHK